MFTSFIVCISAESCYAVFRNTSSHMKWQNKANLAQSSKKKRLDLGVISIRSYTAVPFLNIHNPNPIMYFISCLSLCSMSVDVHVMYVCDINMDGASDQFTAGRDTIVVKEVCSTPKLCKTEKRNSMTHHTTRCCIGKFCSC